MDEFQIHLKIPTYNDEVGKYEFMWEGKSLSSDFQEIDIVIKCEDHEAALKHVDTISDGTVSVMEVFKPSQHTLEGLKKAEVKKEPDHIEQLYIDLVTTRTSREMLNIIGSRPATISNN